MAENQNVKDRLLEFLKSKNIKKSHFEKQCGLSNGYINSMVNSISYEKLEGILKEYPELNPSWLMNGEGTMLRTDATAISFKQAEINESDEVKELKRLLEEERKKNADLTDALNKALDLAMEGRKVCG